MKQTFLPKRIPAIGIFFNLAGSYLLLQLTSCIRLYTIGVTKTVMQEGAFIMKSKDVKKEGHHRGDRHKGRGGSQHHGPKTFRRGRAIAFLEMMHLKRTTIKQQLEQPEFQSIQQMLIGELKAIDMVINEFSQLFEIHESEAKDVSGKAEDTEAFSENGEKGREPNETNEQLY